MAGYPRKRSHNNGSGSVAKRLKRVERQVAMNKAEKKYLNTTHSASEAIFDVSVTDIPQGIGNGGRTGTDVYLKKLDWQFTTQSILPSATQPTGASDARFLRFIIYSPKNDPNQTLANQTPDVFNFDVPIDLEQFNVYRDFTRDVALTNGVIRGSLSLTKMLTFVGNSASLYQGSPVRLAIYQKTQEDGEPPAQPTKGWTRTTYCDK